MEHLQGNPGTESSWELAQRLNLGFSNHHLLSRALTHRSYLNEHPEALEDNERLEFLGDAVLDFLVGAWLYHRYPEMAEGSLTRLRSALVRTEQLAEFARQINLKSAMRLGRGEAESGGYERPALLCATFEALIGAYYIDAGIPAVQTFIKPLLESATERLILMGKTRDPKSELQEWTQARGAGAPTYITVSSSGPAHDKLFEVEVLIFDKVYGRGTGRSKQAAAKMAARQALQNLGVAELNGV